MSGNYRMTKMRRGPWILITYSSFGNLIFMCHKTVVLDRLGLNLKVNQFFVIQFMKLISKLRRIERLQFNECWIITYLVISIYIHSIRTKRNEREIFRLQVNLGALKGAQISLELDNFKFYDKIYTSPNRYST